ncbi:hypothetical protein DFO55_114131 [Grimontella sp. AG753]|nr:hypothetical protein DFO55_114131 [Grimontella sp. AG753]TCW48963.1 hypothetical protein EDC53_104344 [Phytobacter diazotrophicus]
MFCEGDNISSFDLHNASFFSMHKLDITSHTKIFVMV